MNHILDIAVFGSGRGSNFEALLKAVARGNIPGAKIRVVISNNSRSGILEIARDNGIPAVHLSERLCSGEQEFTERLLATLRRYGVNLIVLAGYMRLVPRRIIGEYRNRIINIHPALLPKFGGQGMYGMRVHEAVIASGERYSGATVHVVDEEYDRGAIVLQRRVEVTPEDTAETLAAKVLSIEHKLLPDAVRKFAAGDVPEAVVET